MQDSCRGAKSRVASRRVYWARRAVQKVNTRRAWAHTGVRVQVFLGAIAAYPGAREGGKQCRLRLSPREPRGQGAPV